MKQTRISRENLITIRKDLPHGVLKQIAKKCGVPAVYVTRLLQGARGCQSKKDLEIFEAVIDAYVENHIHNKTINGLLKLLIDQLKETINEA